MTRTKIMRDEPNMQTIVRMRNAVGGWSTLVDEAGRAVDFTREALETRQVKFRSTEDVFAFFARMDKRFDEWWSA